MSDNIVILDDAGNIVEVIEQGPNIVEVQENVTNVIEVHAPGPRGPKGEKGDTGLSGAGVPFYELVGGSKYATTASLVLYSDVSSSLYPATGSSLTTAFSLGTQTAPWSGLYLQSQSLYYAAAGELLVSISADYDSILIGNSVITTSSFGFTTPILSQRGVFSDIVNTGSVYLESDGTNDIMTVRSGSTDRLAINQQGVLVLKEWSTTPDPVPGGIMYSGSNFYFGM